METGFIRYIILGIIERENIFARVCPLKNKHSKSIKSFLKSCFRQYQIIRKQHISKKLIFL